MQRWLIGLALSALLAAQWLALAHGVVHRGAGGMRSDAVQAAGLAQDLLKVVAGHDEKSPACQLFDQLAQTSAPGTSAPELAPAPASKARAGAVQPLVPAGPRGLYQARAPPVLA
ncbi:MAG: hypothetical protein AB1430_15000 [Pseudomonadota bacterium]